MTWYTDEDLDRFRNDDATQGCNPPEDALLNDSRPIDCDDTNPAVSPNAREECGDNIDNDCDGEIDEDGEGLTTFYPDGDQDGFPSSTSESACPIPTGAVLTQPSIPDCDDTDPTINPGVEERCGDTVDNDCDGRVDDAGSDAPRWFSDQDRDGYGVPPEMATCAVPTASVSSLSNGEDCDDTDPASHPNAVEIWYDDRDQACDGGNDYDQDGDGVQVDAAVPDCDDTNPQRSPLRQEVCGNGVDDDCDDSPLQCVLPANTDLWSVAAMTVDLSPWTPTSIDTGDFTASPSLDIALGLFGDGVAVFQFQTGILDRFDDYSFFENDLDAARGAPHTARFLQLSPGRDSLTVAAGSVPGNLFVANLVDLESPFSQLPSAFECQDCQSMQPIGAAVLTTPMGDRLAVMDESGNFSRSLPRIHITDATSSGVWPTDATASVATLDIVTDFRATFVAHDVNQDGFDDIVSTAFGTRFTPPVIAVTYGPISTGSTANAPRIQLSSPANSGTYGPAIACDLYPDNAAVELIAGLNGYPHAIQLFAAPTSAVSSTSNALLNSFAANQDIAGPYAVGCGDLNGDSYDDLAGLIADNRETAVHIVFGLLSGTNTSVETRWSVPETTNLMHVSDMDGDGNAHLF